MEPTLEVIKTTIKEEYGKSGKPYATLVRYKTEVGFIDSTGVYLRLYNPGTPYGVLWRVYSVNDLSFAKYVQFVVKYWDAIWDRYDFAIKHGNDTRRITF